MVMFDTLRHFGVFPDDGGLLDQSPLVWHDLRQCYALLGKALDDEDDEPDDDDSAPATPFMNAEDL